MAFLVQLVVPIDLLVLDRPVGFRDAAVDTALGQHVDIVGGQHLDPLGRADQRRVGEHHVPHVVTGGVAEEIVERLAVGARVDLREQSAQRVAHHRLVVALGQRFRQAGVLRIDLGRVDGDVERDAGLPECSVALRDDRDRQEAQHEHREADRQDAIEAEAPLGGVAPTDAGFRKVRPAQLADRRDERGVSHTSLDICARR
jgi:hypothetical protein